MTNNKSAQGVPSLKDLKAMVVDDSKTILRSAEIYLQKIGCQVLTAQDGFESLSIIADFKPDIIFLDIMMPRLDGYQTCAIIKSNPDFSSIPVIMLSSKNNLFDKARGRLAGSEEYITKPFTEDDLRKALQPYVAGGAGAVAESETASAPAKPKERAEPRIKFANSNIFDDDTLDTEVPKSKSKSKSKPTLSPERVDDPIFDMGFQAPSVDSRQDKKSTKPSISLLDIDLTK